MPIDPRPCLIYAIRNRINGHSYVGSTIQVNRYGQHKSYLDRGTHHCTPLQRAWVKAGGKAKFEFIILEDLGPVSDRHRDLAEIKWIKSDGYYNLVRASDDSRNFTHSKEIREKLALNLKKSLQKPEHRETKRLRSIEMWQNPGIRASIIASLSRKFDDPDYLEFWLSRIHSKEATAKMRESIKIKWRDDPAYRDRLVKAALADRRKPSSKARMRRQTIKNFKNPATKRKHKLATKNSWKDPAAHAARVAAFRTPEAKKNRSAAAKRAWLKRKKNKT
jgi:group I intron endonuclease